MRLEKCPEFRGLHMGLCGGAHRRAFRTRTPPHEKRNPHVGPGLTPERGTPASGRLLEVFLRRWSGLAASFLVHLEGPLEASQDKIRDQRVKQRFPLEQARESARADDR